MTKLLSLLLIFLGFTLFAQSISEKIQGFQNNGDFDSAQFKQLSSINNDLHNSQKELYSLYNEIQNLYNKKASQNEYTPLVSRMHELRNTIKMLEEKWQKLASTDNDYEMYGLWFQPHTTIGQIVIDYGAQDFVYIMSPEIANMTLNVSSHLPIPRESWNFLLELILEQNGIGIKKISPFLKELYLLSNDNNSFQYITNQRSELNVFPPNERICFLLQSSSKDIKSTLDFLNNVNSSQQINIHNIGNDILIIASTQHVRELLKMYDFISNNVTQKNYKIISLKKISPKDACGIVSSFFEEKVAAFELESNTHSLLLIGSEKDIAFITNTIEDLENQIESSKEKIIYWYNTKHSDAQELADVLSRVYTMIVSTKALYDNEEIISSDASSSSQLAIETNPISVADETITTKKEMNNNFIVDVKTGAIIMVVEQTILPKIKQLIKKIDVPKKMVSINVLLCEKRINNNNNIGLNLLKIGSDSSTKNFTNVNFSDSSSTSDNKGLLEFLLGRKEGTYLPSYQLAYNFLLNQEDVQINANPSLITVNQTPASIDLMDEISINTGAVEIAGNNDNVVKDSYERKQYGIHIKITPTIHFSEEEENDFITLKTDIVFDTQKTESKNNRPNVFRRQIKNEVRIANGQSVILGGLHQKDLQDNKEGIPFLGDIPGIGKIFSNTTLSDLSTEMFIFITPTIIDDPIEQLKKIQTEEMKKRPGETNEYLDILNNARKREKQRLFNQTIKMFFGRSKKEKLL